jgi:RAD51-like protein 1
LHQIRSELTNFIRALDSSQAATRQLQRTGLPPRLLQRLHDRNLRTAKDLFSLTLLDLVELLDLPYEVVEGILRDVAAKVAPTPVTALDLWHRRSAASHLRTALPPLDAALHGGLPSGSVTEIVGPAGAGKTQFCLAMCVTACLDAAAEEGRALYLDTERKFSPMRLAEIASKRFPDAFSRDEATTALLTRVLVIAPDSSAELLHVLESLEATIIDHHVKLIIIDSVAALARAEHAAGGIAERQRNLGQQASRLKYLAESFGIPVLVTNQVTTQMGGSGGEGRGLTAALGVVWAHAVNTRLVLAQERGGLKGGGGGVARFLCI